MRTDLRWRIDLSGFWTFRTDPEDRGIKESWYRGFNGEPIYVPSSWNEQNPRWDQFGGVGWYSRDFYSHLPRGRASLVFEGAGYRVSAWLNETYVGEHEGSFTRFKFIIPLKEGWNRLAVRVDNTLTPNDIPPGEGLNYTYFDFFHYGGIHRPVYVEVASDPMFEDLVTTGDQEGNLKVAGTLSQESHVTIKITGPGLHKTWTLGSVSEFIMEERLKVEQWSVERPVLYRVEARTSQDVVYETVGFRTFQVDGGNLTLNGKRIFLKGFGRHEDFPVFGRRIPGPVLVRDFHLMKQVGANSFRTSHYPYSSEHLDLADQMGFLVILEMPLVGLKERHFSDKSYLNKAVNVLREMITEHRSRPSVVMYSLMNEPDSRFESAKEFMSVLIKEARSLDPTRPITHASNKYNEDVLLDLDDVISVNLYYGWYSESGDVGEGVRRAKETVSLLKNRGKPLLVTEFGADAISGLHWDPPVAWSEEYQANFLKSYIHELKDQVSGLHVWNFADFRTPQGSRGPTRTILNRKGVLTRDRQPKTSFFILGEEFNKM